MFNFRREEASPEDIEYFDLQSEFNMDLYKNCSLVERIICKLLNVHFWKGFFKKIVL